MNGKKFVGLFLGLIVISSVGAVMWMKQAYDTRPNVKIDEPGSKDTTPAMPGAPQPGAPQPGAPQPAAPQPTR